MSVFRRYGPRQDFPSVAMASQTASRMEAPTAVKGSSMKAAGMAVGGTRSESA